MSGADLIEIDCPWWITEPIIVRDDYESVAAALAEALNSFMGYDGYGEGGADDSNRGDWRGAEQAMSDYNNRKRGGTP